MPDFDPDAYLAQKQPAFNPDEYLSSKAQPSSTAQITPIIPRSGSQMESLGAREFLQTAPGEVRGTGDKPLIPIPRIPQQRGLLAQAGAGTVNIASGLAEMAETPQLIAALPVAPAKLTQLLFGAQALGDIKSAYEEARQPGTSVQRGLELGGRALTDALFGVGMVHGAVGEPLLSEKVAARTTSGGLEPITPDRPANARQLALSTPGTVTPLEPIIDDPFHRESFETPELRDRRILQQQKGGPSATEPNRETGAIPAEQGQPTQQETAVQPETRDTRETPAEVPAQEVAIPETLPRAFEWSEIKKKAEYVRKGNTDQLVTVSPSTTKEGWSRINYWDQGGIVSHLEVPEERLDSVLQKEAYPRGAKVITVEGGIGGTYPSKDYAGMGFYPDATAAKGVKTFVGPSDSVDWMKGRLESGGYKVSVKDVPEPKEPAPVSEPTETTTAQPLTQEKGGEVGEKVQVQGEDEGKGKEGVLTPEAATVQSPAAPQSITSIKNEQVDRERAARGLPSVVEPAKRDFGTVWDEVTKKIDENPNYPDQVIEKLKTEKRAATDIEDAALLHRQVDLQNQFQKSTDALFAARRSGDQVGVMEHDARVNALSDQLLELYDVGQKAGTETGRGLNARKLLAQEDFSLANMITQKRAANQGKQLTPEQNRQVNIAAKKVSAAQTAYDAYETSPRAEAYRRRLKTLTEQYQQRTASGDFAARSTTPIDLGKEGEQLKADLARSKKDWLTALQKDRAANRTPSQKFWDRFVGVERAMKLSSDVVLAKLTTAAVVREAGLTPAEELAGTGIKTVLPGLAKRAPREGGGFSLDAEIKAKSEMFTSGMKDAWQNLRMKQTDLDALYSGKKPPPPSEFYDYLGYLHGALKAPIKRAEFARSLTKRMKWAVENGQDLNNVNTMRAISDEAYVDANRSIFQQDNVVSSTFSSALNIAAQSKKFPNLGPAVSRIGKFLVPIVKVPTNIVGEVATGVHGLGVGGARAAVAYLKGIDSLPPAEADSIMRQLKKGLIGNSLILAGYYGAQNIGGFYHSQDKRPKGDVQAGRYRIGGVDLPASAGHSTGAMLLNIGATVKRVQDERVKKTDTETKGLGEGIRAAGAGLAHEIPFVPAVTGITDALGSKNGFEKYINGMITSTTTPALSSHIARILDTPGSLPENLLKEPVKRTPTTTIEAIKMGIPGLRQTVPESKSRSRTYKTPLLGAPAQ